MTTCWRHGWLISIEILALSNVAKWLILIYILCRDSCNIIFTRCTKYLACYKLFRHRIITIWCNRCYLNKSEESQDGRICHECSSVSISDEQEDFPSNSLLSAKTITDACVIVNVKKDISRHSESIENQETVKRKFLDHRVICMPHIVGNCEKFRDTWYSSRRPSVTNLSSLHDRCTDTSWNDINGDAMSYRE